MEITVTISEQMRLELEDLSRESGLSVADCAGDILEGNLERLRNASYPDIDPVQRFIAASNCRTPEEIAETQRGILAASKPLRTPPPGKTLEDMVFGKWPGNETDEQIRAALEELS